MSRGSSQSQASSGVTSRPGTVPPRGSAAATAGMRRRRLGGGGGSSTSSVSSSGLGGGGSNMLRFYTDDSPGLKISPTMVLIMSLCFIAFVAVLHVIGKFYRHKSGP
ncbi:hypothetical protein BUALT_Bualt02G0049000 [Buddleja alternifolia]|uniref:Protein transport protein Sec61 subunit beta n=1 Tax=Buddleja alternifolia TaxID=168488 RepID=A0AAV6Y8N6_9LAMI|nr:hypothetical protein BUALT_Bualt02G0049000 [Buddleja alternifolia]